MLLFQSPMLSHPQFQLDQRDDRVIDDTDELLVNAVIDPLRTFFLDTADALRLDEDLVRDGWNPQDPPGGPVVFHLLQKNIFATSNDRVVLPGGFCDHRLSGSSVN